MFKNAGKIFGERIALPIRNELEAEAKEFPTDVYGMENLEQFPRNQSIIFTSNYPGPAKFYGRIIPSMQENIDFKCGFLPSPFILFHHLAKLRQKVIVPYMSTQGYSNTPNATTFMESMIIEAGGIPVNSTNQVTTSTTVAENLLKYSEPYTATPQNYDFFMFLQGRWINNDTLLDKVNFKPKPGVTFLARHFGLTVVPIYIYCPESWNDDDRTSKIIIGDPIPTQKIQTETYKQENTIRREMALASSDPLGIRISESIIELQKVLKKIDNTFDFPF